MPRSGGSVCGETSVLICLSVCLSVCLKQQRKCNVVYLVVFILVGDFQYVHGLDHGLHGCEDVPVDQLFEASLIFIGVSPAMDDPHLLDESTLPTFTSP